MSFSVKTTDIFEKQAKRLIKKYISLTKELKELVQSLKENPDQGSYIGSGCYKVRLSIASKQKGKSGGARVITYVITPDEIVYLLSIYDKSEKENLSQKELLELLKDIS
ncbi:type II toxin-antitoxin system RelE/ParE family toxin [Mucilaginibacter sp. HMF5004]|uniref:type II toxin-antitoxin system RelE/ParE family toxin n=1 Tax=Mucilaginibacter rivuli TaxID=2857527 RepID=UPI001C5D0C20|nr:type II toxin-antitoxin system RelE/ParE family toxin [Mucilaginibacter rivuli]MBW4890204.1 type II toxin-antitoxin system RelE/ParE family toxin [Mucilaginibacter rivuli]